MIRSDQAANDLMVDIIGLGTIVQNNPVGSSRVSRHSQRLDQCQDPWHAVFVSGRPGVEGGVPDWRPGQPHATTAVTNVGAEELSS